MPHYSKDILKIKYRDKYNDFRKARNAKYSSDAEAAKAIKESQQEFVSSIMSYLTNTTISRNLSADSEIYEFLLGNIEVNGISEKPLIKYPVGHERYDNEIFGETYALVQKILGAEEEEVKIPDVEVDKKINTLLYEGLENNKFSLNHSEEVNEELKNLSGLFKNHLLFPNKKEHNDKLIEALDRVQEAFDKYDFVNSKDLKDPSSEEFRKNIKEVQRARELSESVDYIKRSINSKQKNFNLSVKQEMKNLGPEEIADIMEEKNPEQFLLKLTNTKTPEEGLIRLNSLYIDAEVNNNRKDFSKSVRRDWGFDGMIGDKRSLLSELKIRDFNIFDKGKVRGATEAFYKLCKNKLEPNMSLYSLESKVEEDVDSKIEQVSFKKVLDRKDLETYYQKNPPEESKNATNSLNNLAAGLKLENKGSQSDEYHDFKQAFDDLKQGKNSYPNEKLKKSVNELMSYAKTYIMKKREQKGMTSTEVSDKETNDKMVGKIFWGYGKERYEFAVKVYEEMEKMKNNLDMNWKPNTQFLGDKESMSNEARGNSNNKYMSQKTKELDLNKSKDDFVK